LKPKHQLSVKQFGPTWLIRVTRWLAQLRKS
jgi:hypothetical protein